MKTSLKIALLLGVVSFVTGVGHAQMEGSRPPGGPMQGLLRENDRQGDRLARDFDLNHDGKVTHDEMNRTIGARFAAATGHAPGMTLDQFLALRANDFRERNLALFRSLDWNGDGRLSLAEFAAPQHVRFASLDRDGRGEISCAPGDSSRFRQSRGSGQGGLSGFCADHDLDMDGKVTRAELDRATANRFAQGAGGAAAMNASQFTASEEQRFRTTNIRTFRRLDSDGDGKLTVQEFGGSELKLFARLDRNRDGVLSAEEIRARVARADREQRRRYD